MNKQFIVLVDEKTHYNDGLEEDITQKITETILAHKASILANGQLKFVNQNNQLIKAFNTGDWMTVEEIQQEPTPEQTGLTTIESELP